jgi:hypothetical protein
LFTIKLRVAGEAMCRCDEVRCGKVKAVPAAEFYLRIEGLPAKGGTNSTAKGFWDAREPSSV